MSTPVLEIQDLSIRLPAGGDRDLAVQGASLTLEAGQTLCVVGESGSGKSMIANAVMGLLPRPHVEPVAGRILFEGQDLLQLDDDAMRELRGQKIGMVFQEPMTALNPVMRIGDQIAEVFDAHQRLGAAEKRKRIVAALADVGLPDPELLYDSYPFRLSGGQRQRVMIACAMALEPRLLIADEPTTALDVTTQAQILALIRELQQRRGMAVLFITHDFGVVSEIADQVVVMQTGTIVETGPAARVLTDPRHPYTRKLIGAIPGGHLRQPPVQVEVNRVLQVQDLCKTYRTGGSLLRRGREVQAARNVNLELLRGQTLGIVGESGSGKSTVARCIARLIEPSAGEIWAQGRSMSKAARREVSDFRRSVQVVFQDPYRSLNPRRTVGASIVEGPLNFGVPAGEAWARAEELMHLVRLKPDALQRYPSEFSGGQRQRICIARALACEPKVLIADEAVSALDVSVQAQIIALLDEIQQRLDLGILFITHDLRVASQICDSVIVMQHGRIVEQGSARDVFLSPNQPYTRALLAAAPGQGYAFGAG
ncbi:ABC transporter [Cupriavidus basilensis OR16]|uniref:ABC transporter n=1 Tax=Cupriavidus basilensis OR16 TaxID=1127483 RepID=H1SCW5_9BURK|nr:ABC transporter ATP-binding protein [Cupriavidus basilensis]EHP39611.1 ABC transporter [Cupriavidus basilensis OR16]